MREDHLARRWRIIRAIDASPNGLTVTELPQREESGIRMINRDLGALQAAGFTLYAERVEKANHWAFIDNFKSEVPSLFPSISPASNRNRLSITEIYVDASYF
jgi:predicted DNA-binding transcriptional regulator YafY